MGKTVIKETKKKEISASERFTQMIIKEFGNISGNGIELSPEKRKLAQHLFISIDKKLTEHELKRQDTEHELKRQDKGHKDSIPIVWSNINLPKLAQDAIHRINLGLDAFITNHIHIIPYFNSKGKKYDIDLRIGYLGKDYYRRKMATDPPQDIIYELVYENDTFKPIKKDINNKVENYVFSITKPFERGEIIGGFGYIIYENSSKNKLIIVTEKDFEKARKNTKADNFWKNYSEKMRYKTIVHRTTEILSPDPEKINKSYMIVEEQDREEERIFQEIEEKANRELLDIVIEGDDNTEEQIDNEKNIDNNDTETAEGPGF